MVHTDEAAERTASSGASGGASPRARFSSQTGRTRASMQVGERGTCLVLSHDWSCNGSTSVPTARGQQVIHAGDVSVG